MVFSNNNNIPQITYDAIAQSPYVPCGQADYSATSLVDPPRKVQLMKRHGHKVQEDAADRWSRFLGDAIHSKFEKELSRYPTRYLVERKITRFDKDRRVVAKFDAYDLATNTLYDHKTTGVNGYGLEMKDEYIQQLNLNAYFLRKEGFKVDAAMLNYVYLGWTSFGAKYSSSDKYPQIFNIAHDVPVWDEEEQKRFYEERLQMHIDAENLPDDDLPECTPKECWETDPVFAIWKVGGKKALRKCATLEDVQSYVEWRKLRPSEYVVERRPGARRRCQDYCQAAPFCAQYQKWLAEQGQQDEGTEDISE